MKNVASVIDPTKGLKLLDKLIADCKAIVSRGAQADWQLGVLLLQIFNKELWTLVKTPDGKQRYRRFWNFCYHELSVSPPTVTRCTRFARSYTFEQLKGASSLIAQKLLNVKDPQTRNAWLAGSPRRSLTWVEAKISALPASELCHPLARKNKIYFGSMQSVGDFIARAHGQLKIMVRGDDFIVTYTTKGGLTRIGRDELIQRALEEALRGQKRTAWKKARTNEMKLSTAA